MRHGGWGNGLFVGVGIKMFHILITEKFTFGGKVHLRWKSSLSVEKFSFAGGLGDGVAFVGGVD